MLINELFEDKSDKDEKGTYAAARFSQESKNALTKYIKNNKIVNSVDISKLHATLLYSRAYIKDYKPVGKYDKPIECKPMGFEIWPSKPDEKTGEKSNCLVLKLDAPEFKARHKELMSKYKEATYDFPEFKTHVTLSYSVDDLDPKELPEFNDILYLNEEYSKPLDLDWAKNNTAKK